MPDYEVAERTDDFVILRLRGALLDDVPIDRIHDELERHYVDDGVKRIRTDLSGVSEISLEGVAALLDLWRESGRRGKTFVVEGAAGQVRDKLATTGVLGLLSAGQRTN